MVVLKEQSSLLEIGAVELGSFPALDKCTSLLTGFENYPANVTRAVAILKRYVSVLERRPHFTVEQMDERMVALTAIIPLFQRLVDCDSLSASVLPDFAAFVSMIPCFMSSYEDLENLRCQPRRAFTHCGDISLLANLAHISFGKQRTWEKGPGGYVLHRTGDDGRGKAVVNIRQIGKYFPWKEQSGMALKRYYLERAVKESNDENALESLANLYRVGEYGVSRDWAKAYSLYARALKLSYRPEALFYQSVMPKDGGSGLDKDEEKALTCFDNATTEGYYDIPFVAGSLVRLSRRQTDAVEVTAILQLLEDTVEESENAMSAYSMALILQFGHFGITRNLKRSKELYVRAMELGKRDAAGRLVAFFYEDSAYADLVMAVELTCRSITDRHDLDAFYTLGIMVKNGRGVEKDGPLALRLFQEGMRRGEDLSASQLVGMLSCGCGGVLEDTKKAVSVCRQFLKYHSSEHVTRSLGCFLLQSDDEDEQRIGIQLSESLVEVSASFT